MKPRTPGSAERLEQRLEQRLEAEKQKKAQAKKPSSVAETAQPPPPPALFRRRASLALRQVVVSGTETALKARTGGLVQDFLRRDEEAGRLLGDNANRCLIDSSGSEEEAVKEAAASPSNRKDPRRQGIFADRSFWRRARQIACFEYTSARLRNNVNTFWKGYLSDSINGRERARLQSKEIYLVVRRFHGLKEAVQRQCELLAFRHALRDRREAEAALTTKLHRQFRAEGDKGPHAFWHLYHKEDSKWMLPASSAVPGDEESQLYRSAYNRQLPDAKLVASSGGSQEPQPSSPGHATMKSKRSQAARKVIQHRRDINMKRLPAVEEVRPVQVVPEVPDFDLDSRPGTRQDQGRAYFDLGRFLEPTRRPKPKRGARTGSLSVPSLPQLGSRERSRQGGMGETMSSMTSSGSSWWCPENPEQRRRHRSSMAPVLEEQVLGASRSLPSLVREPPKAAAVLPRFSLEAVAEPFVEPWQSEVRTQTGLREPEAEEDSATMHYIRVCNATGVVPTAAVLDMVRSHAITSGGEFLLDDELLAMSTMIRHLDRIGEVSLAGSTKLSDAVLNSFLQKLFGRPAMDSLEKLDLARCRGAGPKAMATLVKLVVEPRGLYKLRHLDVSGIKISNNTLQSLCSAVHLHPAIRCLRLQDTGLGQHPAAANCLQDVLNAPALEVLGLGWNSFSEQALQALGDMLASHKRLRELHLPNCDCRARGGSQPSMHIFLEGLHRNSSLSMLDLSMNRLMASSALILEDSLAKHAKLQELYVGQNPLGVHGLRCLLRLLGQPTCGLRMLDAVGCQGTSDEGQFAQGYCGYRASEPTGNYQLDLALCHSRSLLRLLYQTCETLKLEFNKAFLQLVVAPSRGSTKAPAKFQHPSGRDASGVYPVPAEGIISFFFSLDEARARLVPEAEGLDGKFRGPRPLASLYLDRHLALLRRKLSIRKVVPLLAHFRGLRGRSDEQLLLLEALSSDFTLEYEFLAQIGEDAFNGIDALCSLLPGVHRSQLRLFLALTHLPRLREYIKVYKRCERLMVFNVECPTGRYLLNLTNAADFAVAEMLKMLDAWESSVARVKGLEDRSKYGNWSSVRNCVHQGVAIQSYSDLILPCSEQMVLDFVTWRRPAKDATAFPTERWDEMMVQLAQAPLQPEAKVQVLRGLADRVFLSALQCRQLVAVFAERAYRLEVLTFLLLRLSDPQNLKMIASRVVPDEWEELRCRLGTLTLFPYIQPEQHQFVLDTSIPEDRVAAYLTVWLNLKESRGRLGNLRQPRLVFSDKTEFAFDRGVPTTWKDLQAIPQGALSWQYMAAPEDRSLEMRMENMVRYGGWSAEIDASKIIWWGDVQAVPDAVSSFLVHVMRHFKNNLRAAFQMIDGPDGNGKLSLKEFRDAFGRLGWKEFKDSEKAVEIFRYLDPDRGGSVSWEEWLVLDNLLKELQLAILELLQYVQRTFGSLEVAYEFLDKDGSSSVDCDEWCQAIRSMGYHGPSGIIYKYLCSDVATGQLQSLSRERWDQVNVLWEQRSSFYRRILHGG